MSSGDLLVIVPTRGRPGQALRLLKAVHATAQMQTHVHFCIDEDDPALEAYLDILGDVIMPGDTLQVGEPDGLTGWTNKVAVPAAKDYPFLASFGDDHVPATPGWDLMLTDAVNGFPGGTGYAYANDGNDKRVPEAVVMSSHIVSALGWMAQPRLRHFCIDHAWLRMGTDAGCIRYLPDVRIDHMHHSTGRAPLDSTYSNAIIAGSDDIHEYGRWCMLGVRSDVRVLRELIAARTA